MGLLRTHRNWAALFIRIALAAICIPHGLDKLIKFAPLGYAGPDAWYSTLSSLLGDLVTSDVKRYLAITSAYAELVCGISCVLGLLVRICVIPFIFNTFVAIVLVTGKNGFWVNNVVDGKAVVGFEYNLVLIIIAFGLMFSGAGTFSLDKLVAGEDEHYYDAAVEYDDGSDYQHGHHH